MAGACLGVCVLGKADKRVTAGASIASLIFSYIAQRWLIEINKLIDLDKFISNVIY